MPANNYHHYCYLMSLTPHPNKWSRSSTIGNNSQAHEQSIHLMIIPNCKVSIGFMQYDPVITRLVDEFLSLSVLSLRIWILNHDIMILWYSGLASTPQVPSLSSLLTLFGRYILCRYYSEETRAGEHRPLIGRVVQYWPLIDQNAVRLSQRGQTQFFFDSLM